MSASFSCAHSTASRRRLLVLGALWLAPFLLHGRAHAGEPYCQANPSVVYCNDFETGSWDGMEHAGDATLVTQGQSGVKVFSGAGALQAIFNPGGARQPELGVRFAGTEQIYVRFYVRFDATWTAPMHHFYAIHGDRADNAYSCHASAGCRPDGERCLNGAGIDHVLPSPATGAAPGVPTFYSYSPTMHCDAGGYCSGSYAQGICDGCATLGLPCRNGLECCWGNLFSLNQGTAVTMHQDQWYAMEAMVKANSLDAGGAVADGELALWVHGVLVAHHTGQAWRNIPELLLNHLEMWNYYPEATTTHRLWLDNLVVSRAPIGLLGNASHWPRAPTILTVH